MSNFKEFLTGGDECDLRVYLDLTEIVCIQETYKIPMSDRKKLEKPVADPHKCMIVLRSGAMFTLQYGYQALCVELKNLYSQSNT